MKHIELSNVSFHNGDRVILDNVTAGFTRNHVTAILGRSRGGKSTLLQLVLGILRPTTGTIRVDGACRTYPMSPRQRFKFGYVAQGNGLFPHLTAAENIALPGKTMKLGIKASASRVEMLLMLGGLSPDSEKMFPYQMSQADQIKVLICRAYFPDPEVLLMDEPFGAVKAGVRKKLQEEFLHFQLTYPRTVLLVTHDLEEARKLADDILVLDEGKVQQYDSCENVLMRPANIKVQHVLQAAIAG